MIRFIRRDAVIAELDKLRRRLMTLYLLEDKAHIAITLCISQDFMTIALIAA